MKNLKTLTPKKLYQLTVTERIKGRAININKIYCLIHSLNFIECFKLVNFIEFLVNSTEFST